MFIYAKLFDMLISGLALAIVSQSADKPALRGLDPVALTRGMELRGKSILKAQYLRYTYTFATQENLDTFLNDKVKYSIQLGGACGSMGPLSGKGNPDRFTVTDHKIYIFASNSCQKTFNSNRKLFTQFVPTKPKELLGTVEQGLKSWEAARSAHGIPEKTQLGLVWIHDLPYTQNGQTKIWRELYSLSGIESFFQHHFTVGTEGFFTGIGENTSWETDGSESFSLHPSERNMLRGTFLRHPYALLKSPSSSILGGEFGKKLLDGTATYSFTINVKGVLTNVFLNESTKQIDSIEYTDYYKGRIQPVTRKFLEYKIDQGVSIPIKWVTGTVQGESIKWDDEYVVQSNFSGTPYAPYTWIPDGFDPSTIDIDP